MATRATFVWRGDEFAKRVIPEAVASGLNAAAARVSGEIVSSIRRSSAPSPPGVPPRNVHGQAGLVGSIITGLAVPGYFKATVGTKKRYARILEFGGDISPVTSKYLTIPLTKTAQAIREENKSLRGFDGRVFKSKAGNLILVIGKKESGKKGRGHGDAVFLLKERVHVRARPFLRPGLRRATPKAVAAMKTAMRNHIMGAVV